MASELVEARSLPFLKIEKDPELEDVGWETKKEICVGICVMEKKAMSAPMTAILDRLRAFGEFEIVMFGDKAITENPIQQWPLCDALIAFHSKGFPLEKAQAYAELRKPFVVNELQPQFLLHDRRKVYQKLEERGLPTPNHVIVNRDFPNQDLEYFFEDEDYIELRGKRIYKPFVEKPSDGDDHSVMIYYPSSAGGGMKELFRKVGNRSSDFHPDMRRVRREGSYIYEEFMATGGTDVKVYTVGPDYAHAEARKSPVVDGVVMRSADGKEIRYPVLLTPIEKEMARTVTEAFGQAVCGFDLLRSQGKSYVCDVNGWSFVKNSHKYYDDAACVLRGMLMAACAPSMYSPLPPKLPWLAEEDSPGFSRQSSIHTSTFGKKEELRCIVAVIRHGDRTPKQKVKLKVTQDRLLSLMLKYNGNRPRAEAKLKSAVQLQDLLDALRMLVPTARYGRDSDSEAEDYENAEKLRHVKAVLEEGGHFSGIYRKAQLKPQKWAMVHKEDGEEGEVERPTEALMVLKYGGVLTHAGRKQAEELGRWFRFNVYPEEAGEGTGLIRLHSTYRHDLKIYSSDEGRVQMSAAAFTKGLLDLEGPLTPILVSLVSKDSPMLDGLDTASIEMEDAKRRLYQLMTSPDPPPIVPAPEDQPWMVDGGGLPLDSLATLKELVTLVKAVTAQVKDKCKEEEEELHAEAGEKAAGEEIPPYDTARALGKARLDVDRIAAGLPCGSENFLLMFARWKKLERDVFNERKDKFDISKIPDIYDSAKYDLLHNEHLGLKNLDELYNAAKALADGAIPNEYGINPHQKLVIGSKIARRLLGKIAIDLQNTAEECKRAIDEAAAAQKTKLPRLDTHAEDPSGVVRSPRLTRINSRGSATSEREDEEDAMETPYRLDPHYANVRTPQRHVRTRLYFTSESHIHSLMNVLRYSFLDERLQGEKGLVCQAALKRLFEVKELDYLTHIVICMYENTEVDFSDPKRFRIELLCSPGAAYSPLEVSPRDRDHTLPVMEPESLQDEESRLDFVRMCKMLSPFAMPAEDFPPPALPQSFAGFFSKTNIKERIANMWPFNQLQSGSSTPKNKSDKCSQDSNSNSGKCLSGSGSAFRLPSSVDGLSSMVKKRSFKDLPKPTDR